MLLKKLMLSKIFSNIGWLLIDKVIRLFLGVIISILLSRYLGPGEFGILNYSLAYIMLFSSIAGMGIQGIVVRDLIQFPNLNNTTLGTSFVITLLSGLLSYLLVILSLILFKDEQKHVNVMIYIIGSLLLFKFADVVQFFFESKVESKYVVWIQNSVFIFFSICKAVMIFLKMSLISFAWVTALEYLVSTILMIFVFNYRGIKIVSLQFDCFRAKEILKEAMPLMLSSIAIVVYMKSDQIILGQLLDSKAVGIYSAAVRISELWYFVPVIITSSVFPNILRAKHENIKIYYEKLQNLFSILVLISLVVAIPMTFISTSLITFLYGNEYSLAGQVLSVHIWAGVFVSLGQSSYYWYLAENKLNLALQRTFLGAISNLILNFVLIPRYGVIGSAYACLIAQMLSGFIFDLFHKSTRELFLLKVNSFQVLRNWKLIKSVLAP